MSVVRSYLWVFLCLISFAQASKALENSKSFAIAQARERKSAENPLRYFLLLGQQMRQEKTLENAYEIRFLQDLILGVGVGNFNYTLEHSKFSEVTGNETLNVDRKYESYSAWLQYEFAHFDWAIPYLSAGLGAAKEANSTELFGASSTATSPWLNTAGVGCGFRAPLQWIYLGAEARLVTADGWNPDTSVYLLGRVGLSF